MLISLQIAQFLHFIAFSLTLGGLFTSYLLSKRCPQDASLDKGAFIATHWVAAPGLVLLLISGLWQGSLAAWLPFKAPYMHSKMLLLILIVFLVAVDIRTQGNMKRALGTEAESAVRSLMLKRKTKCELWAVIALVVVIFIMKVH